MVILKYVQAFIDLVDLHHPQIVFLFVHGRQTRSAHLENLVDECVYLKVEGFLIFLVFVCG